MTIANDRSGTMAEHLLRQARQRRLLHNDLRTRAAQLLSIDHLASPNQTFTQLSAGDLHTCGLSVGGPLWCWGLYARQPL